MRQLVILDLDGTLYRGDTIIPGAKEMVEYFSRRTRVVFLTNDSTRERESLSRKLTSLGFDADPRDIHTSATMTARYLREHHLRKAYVIGSPALAGYIEAFGTRVTSDPAMAKTLVVGFDREISYGKIDSGFQIIVRGGAFVACNCDRSFPSEYTTHPGGGAVVEALRYSSGRDPLVVGKPSTYSLEVLSREYGVEPSSMLVVGDSLDVDIRMAEDFHCKSLPVSDLILRERAYERVGI